MSCRISDRAAVAFAPACFSDNGNFLTNYGPFPSSRMSVSVRLLRARALWQPLR